MKLLLRLVLGVSLTVMLNASASSSDSASPESFHKAPHKKMFKKVMLDDFHDAMSRVVDNWNELGKSVNKVADNIDDNITSSGEYPGKPWPIGLSSILLENVNVQLRSIIVQIAEALLRINKKKGGPNPTRNSSQAGSSSQEDSEGRSKSSEHSPSHHGIKGGQHSSQEREFDLSKLASLFGQNVKKNSDESNDQGEKFDMSKLATMFSGAKQPTHHNGGVGGGIEMSSIKSLLSHMIAGMSGSQGEDKIQGKGFDLSQLASLFASLGGRHKEHEE